MTSITKYTRSAAEGRARDTVTCDPASLAALDFCAVVRVPEFAGSDRMIHIATQHFATPAAVRDAYGPSAELLTVFYRSYNG